MLRVVVQPVYSLIAGSQRIFVNASGMSQYAKARICGPLQTWADAHGIFSNRRAKQALHAVRPVYRMSTEPSRS